MKRIFILCFVLSFMSVIIRAQEESPLFAVLEYMKVKPGNFDNYVSAEQNIWKPMHQERVDRGIISGWYLYAVQFAGTGEEYNYVVINFYKDLNSIENPWSGDIPKKVHPDKSAAQIMEATSPIREQVRSELCYIVAHSPEDLTKALTRYLQVNFMQVQVSNEQEYQDLEKNIWQPVHEYMVDNNLTSGWSVWGLIYPRGEKRMYQYLTMDAVSRIGETFEIDFSQGFEVLHPGLNYESYLRETNSIRTIARTELWELIDYVVR